MWRRRRESAHRTHRDRGVLGGRLAGRIPDRVLRQGFGWFVVAMGAVALSQPRNKMSRR